MDCPNPRVMNGKGGLSPKCQDCLAKDRARKQAKRWANRAAGLCVKCSGTTEGYTLCERCRAKRMEYYLAAQERKACKNWQEAQFCGAPKDIIPKAEKVGGICRYCQDYNRLYRALPRKLENPNYKKAWRQRWAKRKGGTQ